MSPEQVQNLKEWIAALRSGKYEQGRLYLSQFVKKDNNKVQFYCCLGVASSIDESVKKKLSHNEPHGAHVIFEYFSSGIEEYAAPDFIWFTKRFGLERSVIGDLIKMNDCNEDSFSQIADYLEGFVPIGEENNVA